MPTHFKTATNCKSGNEGPPTRRSNCGTRTPSTVSKLQSDSRPTRVHSGRGVRLRILLNSTGKGYGCVCIFQRTLPRNLSATGPPREALRAQRHHSHASKWRSSRLVSLHRCLLLCTVKESINSLLKTEKKKRKDEIDGSRIAFVVSFLFCFFPLPFCSGVDITLLLSVPSTKRHELSGVSHKKKGEKNRRLCTERSRNTSRPLLGSL